jgi:hypothetical protein
VPELKDACDNCGIREAEYESQGGSRFCKPCADDLGLACGEKNKIQYPGHKPLHPNK